MKLLKAFSKNAWRYVLKPLSSLLGIVLTLILLALIFCPVLIITENLGITGTFLGQVVNWEWLAFVMSLLVSLEIVPIVNGKIYISEYIGVLIITFIMLSALGWVVALSIMYPIVIVILIVILVIAILGLLIYKSVKDVEEDGR